MIKVREGWSMQQLKPVDPSLHAHLEGLTIGEGMCSVVVNKWELSSNQRWRKHVV